MPEHHRLEPDAPWVELAATPDDWDAADPELLRTMYAQLVWVRIQSSPSSRRKGPSE